ncbi:hypothetical protein BLOT_011782 [Blomia tropicalis]|nr:hypothetical protein BLOT_011782 [Blomia tropicalis]
MFHINLMTSMPVTQRPSSAQIVQQGQLQETPIIQRSILATSWLEPGRCLVIKVLEKLAKTQKSVVLILLTHLKNTEKNEIFNK